MCQFEGERALIVLDMVCYYRPCSSTKETWVAVCHSFRTRCFHGTLDSTHTRYWPNVCKELLFIPQLTCPSPASPTIHTHHLNSIRIVSTAFLGTTCVFACFSGFALFSERRSLLYIGGLLSSGLSMLFVLSLANLFARSMVMFNIQLYLGLLVFCGFVVFGTLQISNIYKKKKKTYKYLQILNWLWRE